MLRPLSRRASALSASVVLVLTFSVPQSAQADENSHSVTAAVGGLHMTVFGSKVRIASSSAAIDGETAARASAVGVAESSGTRASAKVTESNRRQFARECLPELAMFKVLRVRMACGESRVQSLPPLIPDDYRQPTGAALLGPFQPARDRRPTPVDNGGPQAVGRGSVTGVDLEASTSLRSSMSRFQALLDALTPVREQTIDAAQDAVGPSHAKMLQSLIATLGLRPGDSVSSVATLVGQLVEGTRQASLLASITMAESSAQANSDAQRIVALAATGGGQIDLLPGFGSGGTPLLSVIVGPAKSTSSFDRATAAGTLTDEPAETRILLGLPLVGNELAEIVIEPGTPVTLLAGTPLETTVSAGGGRHDQKGDGSATSYVDGTSVELLRGVKGGIKLQLGQLQSAIGAQFDPHGTAKGNTGVGGTLAVGAGSLLLAAGCAVVCVVLVRRRSSRQQTVPTEG